MKFFQMPSRATMLRAGVSVFMWLNAGAITFFNIRPNCAMPFEVFGPQASDLTSRCEQNAIGTATAMGVAVSVAANECLKVVNFEGIAAAVSDYLNPAKALKCNRRQIILSYKCS